MIDLNADVPDPGSSGITVSVEQIVCGGEERQTRDSDLDGCARQRDRELGSSPRHRSSAMEERPVTP